MESGACSSAPGAAEARISWRPGNESLTYGVQGLVMVIKLVSPLAHFSNRIIKFQTSRRILRNQIFVFFFSFLWQNQDESLIVIMSTL